MKTQNIESGRLIAAIGSSRSGKSAYVAKETEKEPRLLVWDIKGDDDYKNVRRARTKAELVALLKETAGRPGRIAYTAPSLKHFDFFCRAAQAFVKGHYAAGQQCSLVFEETADVTTPAKAPDQYGIILRRYLSYGVNIYAITQRPAESDKTAIGNASIIRVCRLALADDRRTVAKNTGIPLDAIDALRADQEKKQFDFIHADTGAGNWCRGKLSFPGGKRRFQTIGKPKIL